MPIRPRGSIADYKILKSRHFFSDKIILAKGMAFNQSIDDSFDTQLLLTAQGGPNFIEGDNTNITYSGILNLPILISENPRVSISDRSWVDGLDFLSHILGQDCQDIDDGLTKIFKANNNEYDASVVNRINITNEGNQDFIVSIDFSSNVENVFEFTDFNDVLLNLLINSEIPELRAANAIDCEIGFQNSEKQNDFRLMTSSDMVIEFFNDSNVLYGSGIPRPVFTYVNFIIRGGFTIVDDVRNYSELPDNYDLYPPSIQTYGKLIKDQSTSSSAFAINFSDIDSNSTFRFSSDVLYPKISRTVTDGQLFSKINFSAFNRN